MKRSETQQNYLKVKGISKYIQGIRDRDNNHAIIYPDGNYVYLLNGIEVPGREF